MANTLYVSAADIRIVLARDDDYDTSGTAAALEDTEINANISSAQSEVVARISNRYTMPDDPNVVPQLVRDLIIAIAAYLATLNYFQSKDLADTDPVVRRFYWAEGILKGIASGQVSLPSSDDGDGDPDARAQGPVDAVVVNQYQGRMFGFEDFDLGYRRRDPRRWWRYDG